MNSTAVSQDDINAAVWSACDTFRGTIDPSIYKDYVIYHDARFVIEQAGFLGDVNELDS